MKYIYDDKGNKIPTPDFWKDIQEVMAITNVDRVLFAYLKSPINNRKTNDKYGVPITYGCEATIAEIKQTMQQLYDEYELKPFVPPIDMNNVLITSFFGNERIVFEEYDVHYAWDFGASAKTNVYSIGDGIVKKVRFNQSENVTDKTNGLGNYIEIDYEYEGKIYTAIYSHLYPKSTNLKEGQIVSSNQKIGEVGTTGYSTGNHLHFQVSLDGNKIDGLNLIDFSSNL